MEKNTFKPLRETEKSNRLFKNVVRGPYFLCGFVLLFCVTVMTLTALFTNNWRQSIVQSGEWYTDGIWFRCRYAKRLSEIRCINLADKFKNFMSFHKELSNLPG